MSIFLLANMLSNIEGGGSIIYNKLVGSQYLVNYSNVNKATECSNDTITSFIFSTIDFNSFIELI